MGVCVSSSFFTPVEGRKLARNESESRKWVRHLRTRHSSSFYGCQGIIQLHPSFLPLFLLSASPPLHASPGRGKVQPEERVVMPVMSAERMGFNLADQSPLCLGLAFKVCTPTDRSENEAQWINPVWKCSVHSAAERSTRVCVGLG